MIHHGDCVEIMAAMPEASIDAIVCDPPYGIGFMGKEWDDASRLASVPPSAQAMDTPLARFRTGKGPSAVAFDGQAFQAWTEQWAAAALRVAKPGAYLLAFGGTRTVHRMTVALEDAGWIIRDMLVWAYASGFPKSRALLKPAWEPIVMARKPGPLRDLDIDGCRIGTESRPVMVHNERHVESASLMGGSTGASGNGEVTTAGRWPPNLLLTDPLFDGDTEGVVGGGETGPAGVAVNRNRQPGTMTSWYGTRAAPVGEDVGYGDTGTYSRFFLIPKASRSDREPVMPGMLEEQLIALNGDGTASDFMGPKSCGQCGEKWIDPDGLPKCRHGKEHIVRSPQHIKRRNVHPTVKPVELMRHLVRLVTPADGTVLDPFLGSGTTAIAAEHEGRAWVGIEREEAYIKITEARLAGTQRGLGLLT